MDGHIVHQGSVEFKEAKVGLHGITQIKFVVCNIKSFELSNNQLLALMPKGAFTIDVIILGGRGFGKDDVRRQEGGGGVGLKMTQLFYMISGKNFKQFDF